MSSSLDAAKIRARWMAIRREALDRSSLERQRAVCMFPLSVVSVASDMRRIIECVEQMGDTKESTEALAYCEDVIREEYRKQFGRELGQ